MLQEAFRALCARHDALRSVFAPSEPLSESTAECTAEKEAQNEEPGPEAQSQAVSVRLISAEDCLDFRHIPHIESSEFELDWLLDEQYKVFDLEAGPLCRVRILQEKAEADAWILHWTLHHVSADLWSYTVLLKDLEWAYESYKLSGAVTWPSPAPQYRSLARTAAPFTSSLPSVGRCGSVVGLSRPFKSGPGTTHCRRRSGCAPRKGRGAEATGNRSSNGPRQCWICLERCQVGQVSERRPSRVANWTLGRGRSCCLSCFCVCHATLLHLSCIFQ